MEYKEEVLANISSILKSLPILPKGQGTFKEILRCCGLGELYDENSEFLEPYIYNYYRGKTYENRSPTYNVFIGLDNILSKLYDKKDEESILKFLIEIVKHFNTAWIEDLNPDNASFDENVYKSFDRLNNLYNVFGLQIVIDYQDDEFDVRHFTQGASERVKDVLIIEQWLKNKSHVALDAYISAITSYENSHAGATIESCRTTLTSIFSQYKGPSSYAKWQRGIAMCSGELSEYSTTSEVSEWGRAIDQLSLELSEFFVENTEGKFKKTKAIYSIYSMMSDYGTHRGESSVETPSMRDALMALRMTEDILIWIYMRDNQM